MTDVYVVPHTHWDREWYHTAARFRQRLVALVDDLLDDATDDHFLLDGQAILLDDYWSVRPDRAPELSARLRSGHVEAGPWYVLSDELIPSGEALVRNLIAGRRTVHRFGGTPPAVLYCPDSFGHPAALPDIAEGFGCQVIILWRGFGGARSPQSDVVRWTGVTGSTALVYHLPPDGYEFGSSLPTTADASRDAWARLETVLSSRAVSGMAILLNGADHHARQRQAGLAYDLIAHAALPVRIHVSSLQDSASALVRAAIGTSLPNISGELRDSYGYTWTLQGTLGTRAAQKRRNATAERALVHDLEPWIALGREGGTAQVRALLDAAWRTLLQCHPHDTLCGTSVDAVADAFDARMAAVEEHGVGLRRTALNALLSHDEEVARTSPDQWKPVIVVRNPVARARSGVAEFTILTTVADIAVGPGSASRQGARRRVAPLHVNGVELQVLAHSERVDLTESPRAYPDADLVRASHAVGWIDHIGGFGVMTMEGGGAPGPSVPHPVVTTPNSLDNGRIRVEVNDRLEVSILDHALGRRVDHLLAFERRRDVGDLYTPALRETLDPLVSRSVRLTHKGPLRGEIEIRFATARRGASRSKCRVVLRVDANSPFVSFHLTGDNRDRDQRLRCVVRTGLSGARTVADAAFTSVERHALVVDAIDSAMEHVVPTAPLHRWVTRFTHDAGATLFSDGLGEYESLHDGSIAVTLVRSVGELSRSDLPERPGHAGWPSPTPEAQSIGAYVARFALMLHGPDSQDVRSKIRRCADDVLLPIVGETLRSNLRPACSVGGLELSGHGLSFSAALPAQREGWIVLRCINYSDAATNGEWRLGRAVHEAMRARLDETPAAAEQCEGSVIRFTAAPREIVTILTR